MRKMKRVTILAAVLAASANFVGVQAAFDENLTNYTLDAVVVEADRTQTKFGDTITEQSYYRTGGDVKVITREEIEKRHYTDLTEAIKRIPGVTFQNPGYRGGEYGYSAYNDSLAINGDSRVVVLVDGRRIDNGVSNRYGSSVYGGTQTMVNLDQAIDMNQVEKIEVIKGPGASAYGSDATGGVINIITRKGGDDHVGTLDISTGSWKQHNYALTYSGSGGEDKSWKYFLSLARKMADDSRYHDGLTDKDYAYKGTHFKEESASVRIDKEINEKQSLRFWYNHQNGKDGYPITARDYRYWSPEDWQRIIERTTRPGGFGNGDNPGYRNLFSLDALSGSYNAYRHNDWDLTFVFDKQNNVESFVKVYDQSHLYWGVDRYPSWVLPDGSYVPFPDSEEWPEFIRKYYEGSSLAPTRTHLEKNSGIQLQYGTELGKHEILGSVTFDNSRYVRDSKDRNTGEWNQTKSKRKTIYGYLQDKIHINEKWDLTPSVRYVRYSDITNENGSGVLKNHSMKSTSFTPSIHTQYLLDDTWSVYLGWDQIYRPIKNRDYTDGLKYDKVIKDETGNVWTMGTNKKFGDKTVLGINYSLVKMSNAVTGYPIWDKDKDRFVQIPVNAKRDKYSFNVTLDHQLSEDWSVSLAYTHLKDKWAAKPGEDFDPNLGMDKTTNVNYMINRLRPQNHYTLNINYDHGKIHSGLLVNWYTGMSTEAFTSRRALVLDWSFDYDVNAQLGAYIKVNNLTNEAYENAYSAYNGIGAAPQPGRSIIGGVRYKF